MLDINELDSDEQKQPRPVGRPQRPVLRRYLSQARCIFWRASVVLRAKQVAGKRIPGTDEREPESYQAVIRAAYEREYGPFLTHLPDDEDGQSKAVECNALLRWAELPETKVWLAQNDTLSKLKTALRLNRAGRRRRVEYERGPNGEREAILF